MDDIAEKQSNILIVDDTPNNLHLLVELLSQQGYRVRAALNGALALKTISSWSPDLILLDIMMPDMDGYEVCRHLKSAEHSRDIPVIFISAKTEVIDKIEGFELGGVDYVTKPFEAVEVLARVKTHLTLQSMQKQLKTQYQQLQQEMEERKKFQTALQKINDELEQRVKERTQELEKAHHALEAVNRAKTAFLANVTHELRTPLHGILGYSQILQHDETLLEKQQAKIDAIYKNGEYLLTLVNDILDIARTEEVLHPEEFLLLPFLREIVDLFQTRAVEKDLHFQSELEQDLPQYLYVDKRGLRLVLINLLSNAIKFTTEGRISFKVNCEDNKIHFVVKDTGIGIASENIKTVFLPFEQVEEWQNKTSGLGIGLAITQRLVSLMEGELHLNSKLNQGSQFTVSLQLPKSSNQVETVLDEQMLTALPKTPLPSQLETIQLLIDIGDYMEIIEEAKKFACADPELTPFSDKLIELAKRFDNKNINKLLQHCLDA